MMQMLAEELPSDTRTCQQSVATLERVIPASVVDDQCNTGTLGVKFEWDVEVQSGDSSISTDSQATDVPRSRRRRVYGVSMFVRNALRQESGANVVHQYGLHHGLHVSTTRS